MDWQLVASYFTVNLRIFLQCGPCWPNHLSFGLTGLGVKIDSIYELTGNTKMVGWLFWV